MIEIKRITPPSVLLFAPNGDFEGVVNEYEFHDVRVQIKQAQISGYYIEYMGVSIKIDKNGELEVWPPGLFDQISNSLLKLI